MDRKRKGMDETRVQTHGEEVSEARRVEGTELGRREGGEDMQGRQPRIPV